MPATLNFLVRGAMVAIELAQETVIGRRSMPAGDPGTWDYWTVSRDGILEISLPAPTISRRHFAIRRESGPSGDRYFIRDAGSTCGFRINGERFSGAETELKDRDIIHIQIQFHFCQR